MLEPIPTPWDQSDPVFPVEWGASWVRGTHRDGRARTRALAEVQDRLSTVGVRGAAIVGGPWLSVGAGDTGCWRHGPWPAGHPREHQLWAEGAGDVPIEWVTTTADAFLAACPEPAMAPSVWRIDGGLLVDTALSGRRSGVLLLRLTVEAMAMFDSISQHRATWWVTLMISGLLRADWFWDHWGGVADILVGKGSRRPWEVERPVNPQEVTLHVAEVARGWANRAAMVFEVATVGIFLPDPDDEYVYCLAGEGLEPFAYDAGQVGSKPALDGIGFGLTAAWAMGPVWDASGSPVAVRDLADRAAVRDRYRDLGFDEEAIAADGAALGGPFLAERFIAPERLESAREGPWVFTAQRLPRTLSPTGRNLVVRLQGRTLPSTWSTQAELARTSGDRRGRIAMLSLRIHDEVVRLFQEGLDLWREGVRDEVLRELDGPRRMPALCQALASWTSARAVSLLVYRGDALELTAWSLARPVPSLRLDADARLDSRELRLLHAPLYPQRARVGGEGFLGWPALDEALAGPHENVGTIPIVRAGQPLGVLRVDGVMSLMAGHVRRRSPHGALHQHRPTVTPAHVRPVLEEVARLLALVFEPPPTAPDGEDWNTWIARVRAGHIGPDAVRERLESLHALAPSRSAAADLVGVHRNTFRRHLAQLEVVLPGLAPWDL